MNNSAKTVRRSLGVAAVSLALCFVMLLGTTFAWFTDEVTSAGNVIQSGTLKVDLLHKSDADGNVDGWLSLKDNSQHKIFDYELWEPGYTQVETLKIANEGNLALKYRVNATASPESAVNGKNGEKLADVIDVYVTAGEADPASFDVVKDGWKHAGTLTSLMSDPDGMAYGILLPAGGDSAELATEEQALAAVESTSMTIALHMQESAGNEYQALSVGDIYLNLFATQYTYEEDSFDDLYDENAEYDRDAYMNWDGEVDTEWYNEDTTEYALSSEEEVAALAELVNAGESFAGQTITLSDDIDLSGTNWTPVGMNGKKFEGTFDGNGKTIKFATSEDENLRYGNGFFGDLTGGAVIKNVTFDNVRIDRYGEESEFFSGNVYGIVAGYAYGDVTFENVHVKNSYIRGYGKVGAILGMAADPGGTTTLINCSVENTTIGGVYNIGAFIGMAQNEVVMENCTSNGVVWEQAEGEIYKTFEGEIATESSTGETIDVYGTYWQYKSGDKTYYYTGWADNYNDYSVASKDYRFDDVTYLADGLIH